ncbi:unnamed protein product [Ambrosiozyma monospora]|uniref:Unnamed protein product n=1 Tax=Ambrosiozyma monospora TaxID=43982 RepID=A0ACB5TWQ6_AMBMO|nr:unnamed protein product [Ambrosiozyma monospora]
MSARSRVKRGLSLLFLRLGISWRSGPLNFTYDDDLREYKLIGIKARDRERNRAILSELELLTNQAPMELRLKGPFPKMIYDRILNSVNKIVDAMENLNSIIEMDNKLTETEVMVLKKLEPEMLELENRVFLIFYMLASAMKLGFPLASKPASTEHAMDRLLIKLSGIRKRGSGNKNGKAVFNQKYQDQDGSMTQKEQQSLTNEDFVLLYTYNLVTNSITKELDKLLKLVVELYGSVTEDTLEL